MFIKENVNPKGRKTGDCVIRAIAKAEGKTWLEIFDSLTVIARKSYSVVDSKDVFGAYLKKYPVVDCTKYGPNGNSKYTVEEFASYRKKGTFIVQVSKHLTVIIDGDVYDTWNCLSKKIYKIWEVK